MKNKGIRITYILIFFLILILILCSKGSYDEKEKNAIYSAYEKIDDYERIDTKDSKKHKNESQITLKIKDFHKEKTVIIKAACRNISVYIDDNNIYESKKITSSNIYHSIDIKEDYHNKTMKIICDNSSFFDEKIDIDMYYGDFVSVFIDEIKEGFLEIIFIILEISFGIICICLFFLEGKTQNKKEIFLGLFLICFAIFSSLELGILQAFINKHMFCDILKIELIFIMLFLFLIFEKIYYYNNAKTKKMYKYVLYFLLGISVFYNIVLMCSYTRLYSEKVIEVLLIIVFLLYMAMFYYGKRFIKNEKIEGHDKKNKNIYKNNKELLEKYIRLSIILIFIPCIIDIIFNGNKYFSMMYRAFLVKEFLLLKLGIMAYMILILTDFLERVRKMIVIGKKTLKLEQLAKKDVLTQANSRTSYTEFIKKINNDKELCNNKMIVSFDVNDLKLINDTYGHDAGDDYLIKCADIIKQAFDGNGESYRIGGDEFIVIIDEFDAKKFEISKEKLKYLQKRSMRKEDNRPISIAYGYAKFDAKLDNNILDTVKRADAMMYRKKNKIKARRR